MDDPAQAADRTAAADVRDMDTLVRRAAAQFGTRECLRFEGRSISFIEFEERTRELASRLARQGIRAGERVGIMLPNGLEWPTTWVAVLRAGAVAVPLNAKLQHVDLSFLLSDSGAKIAITDEERLPLLQSAIASGSGSSAAAFIYSDLFDDQVLEPAPHHDLDPPSPDSVANLQYTSGTTGFPKACVLTHEFWIDNARAIGELCQLSDHDVVLTAQPFSYVDPPWQLAMSLQYGAPLVVLPGFSASGFWPSVRDNRATVVYVLGAMPMLLYKQPPTDLDRANCLRLVLCSGIMPERHRDFEDRWGVPWRELYGLTEEGCCLAVPLDSGEMTGSGSIGRPFGDKQVTIGRPDGTEALPRERGEVLVRGGSIMLSYWNKPEESAKALADGWFHTGDIAWRDEDGWFFLVGRVKDMIRRGGENIAAAEVEAVLNDHPWVEVSAVVPEADEIMGEEPKACLTLTRSGSEHSADEVVRSIAEFAASRLAKFKNPRYLQLLETMPRTASERVSKKQLQELLQDSAVPYYDVKEEAWLQKPSSSPRPPDPHPERSST